MTLYEVGMDVIRACRKVGPMGLTEAHLTRRLASKFGLSPEVCAAMLDAVAHAGRVRKVADRYIATGL